VFISHHNYNQGVSECNSHKTQENNRMITPHSASIQIQADNSHIEMKE